MEYVRWTLQHVLAHPAFEWIATAARDWRERPADCRQPAMNRRPYLTTGLVFTSDFVALSGLEYGAFSRNILCEVGKYYYA